MPDYLLTDGGRPSLPEQAATGVVVGTDLLSGIAGSLLQQAGVTAEAAGSFAQRWAVGKARQLRTELLSEAVANALANATLPFPAGPIAGALGVQVLPPGSITLLDYLALAYAANTVTIRGRTLLAALPGLGGRVLRIGLGPYGVAGTTAGVLLFETLAPDASQDTLLLAVLRGLATGGITEIGGPFPDLLTGRQSVGGTNAEWEALVAQVLAENLDLVEYWRKDP